MKYPEYEVKVPKGTADKLSARLAEASPAEFTALKWYTVAAQKGHAYSQFKLGHLYEEGLGTTQNNNEAAKWYRLSADQGYPDAHDALKAMEQR